jgi:glycosyltransferase involved in cell wall biosynthesis
MIFNRAATVCHPGITVTETPLCEKKNFRMVTRLTREKNVERIINVMTLIREIRPDIYENCSLEIAGEGTDESRLKILLKDSGINNIKFCGFIPDNELPAFYAGAKAIIYIPLDEPFGLVPIEAMAHGTPIIGSNQGGIPETVIDRTTGILIDPVVIEAIAGAIEKLYDDPELAGRLGATGRKRVLERFTIESFINRLEKKFLGLSGVKP